jgi:hypothetical protein
MSPPDAVPAGLLAALFAVSAGGCVIPVAPQFDDPETNYPPYLVSSTPGEGDTLTLISADQPRDLSVTLSDQNLNDALYVRWLVDYPKSEGRLIREYNYPPPATNRMADRSQLRYQFTCANLGVSPGIGPHTLVMAVADRPYLDEFSGQPVDPEAPLDSVGGEGNRIRIVWTVICP